MTTKSPAPMEDNNIEPKPVTGLESWEEMTQGADEILGSDLARDELLDALEGVPFMIYRMTFRPSDAGHRVSYVTCEVQVGPKELLMKRRIDLTTLPFDPGDHVVFNDGSTGIYRQAVAYLHAKGFIALPDPVVPNGHGATWNKDKGEMEYVCSYDLPPTMWQDINAGRLYYDEHGDPIYIAEVRCFAKRGIRISDGYKNEWTQDGKTRYLA